MRTYTAAIYAVRTGWRWRPPCRFACSLTKLPISIRSNRQNLVGIKTHGALTMGCFNAQRSDIDLLVITRAPIDTDVARTVLVRLLHISGQPRQSESALFTTRKLHFDATQHPSTCISARCIAHTSRL